MSIDLVISTTLFLLLCALVIYAIVREIAIALLPPALLTTVPTLAPLRHCSSLTVHIAVDKEACELSAHNDAIVLCRTRVDGHVLGIHDRSTLARVVRDFLQTCAAAARRHNIPLVYRITEMGHLLGLARLLESSWGTSRHAPIEYFMDELGYRFVLEPPSTPLTADAAGHAR